mgnify:CR=1 FL=1
MLAASPMRLAAAGLQPGSSAQQLAQLLRRDKAQITRLVNDLVQAALLQRQPDPTDGRRQQLLLSADGATLAAELKAKKRLIAGKMLHGLSAQQQQHTAAVLAQMYQNLIGAEVQTKNRQQEH